MLETEHRKYDRCAAPEEAFARLQLGSESILGPIKNISKGGLLFEGIDKKDRDKDIQKGCEGEIDIFSLEGNFYLTGMPCKVIHERQLEPTNPITTVCMTRCGVQFEELTRNDEDSIRTFIAYCKTMH